MRTQIETQISYIYIGTSLKKVPIFVVTDFKISNLAPIIKISVFVSDVTSCNVISVKHFGLRLKGIKIFYIFQSPKRISYAAYRRGVYQI